MTVTLFLCTETDVIVTNLFCILPSHQQQQHVTCYRFGSVGEDTHICLWDMTEDTLKKASAAGAAGSSADLITSQSG